MARNDGPDREMERRLREHFSEEARELRAPDDLWARLEGRLGKQREPRLAFLRRATAFTSGAAWVPAAAAALLVVVVGIGVWAFAGGSGDGDGAAPMVAQPAATAAPAARPIAIATAAAVRPIAAATAAATPTTAEAVRAAPSAAPTGAVIAAATAAATAAPVSAPTAAPTAAAAAATPTPAAALTAGLVAPADVAGAGAGASDDGTSDEAPPEESAEPPADAGDGMADERMTEAGDDSDDAVESSPPSDDSSPASERQRTALSAGEVNDNERWDEYVYYRNQYSGPPVLDVDVTERYVITVTDANGRPVHNARVRVSAGEAVLFEGRTYANGQTLFFPRAFDGSEEAESFTLDVETDEESQQLEFARGEVLDWDVTLDLVQPSSGGGVPLDILFLLDATGSMADEIDQIKDSLLSISSRISDLPSQPDLRFGMVAYRDRGDEFVTRVYDFEADALRFLDTIRGVVADGGDDYPESLNEALHVAVHEPDWRSEDAIRLMFLIADAPPHLDYVEDYSYADEMIEAHRRGIKTFAIASSGLDQQGEYVLRQIAQHTMGRFIFIVYGGGGTTSHDVGEYTVERLDDLVVSLVEEELASLSR